LILQTERAAELRKAPPLTNPDVSSERLFAFRPL
jgi:hypothetical protein